MFFRDPQLHRTVLAQSLKTPMMRKGVEYMYLEKQWVDLG